MYGKVSVIVPVYNCEKYVKQSIESILNQTYCNIEVVLVDDGSTDSSGRICDKYALLDERVKVIHQSNQGVSAARNAGLKVTTGEFITFVDADDYVELDMYDYLLEMIRKYDADISHCGYKRVGLDGKVEKEVNGTKIILEQNAREAIECMLSGRYFAPSLCNKLFRKELFCEIEFNTAFVNNEDVLVAFQVFQKAEKIVFSDETKYCYVIHSESACHTIKMVKRTEDAIAVSEIMLKECEIEELLPLLNNRLVSSLIEGYRQVLSLGNQKYDDLRRTYKFRIREKLHDNLAISSRNKLKCLLLLYFPALYKLVYRMYDRVREPQWDAK